MHSRLSLSAVVTHLGFHRRQLGQQKGSLGMSATAPLTSDLRGDGSDRDAVSICIVTAMR